MIKYLLQTIFFVFLLSFANICKANKLTNIFIITDQNYIGDRNNLLGIAHNTKRLFAEHNEKSQIHEYHFKSLKRLRDKILLGKQKSIIITFTI